MSATGPDLTTARLVLRRWRDADRAPFAALNADPEVMRFFPGTLTRAQSDALVDRVEADFAARGFGIWALQRRDAGDFIGYTGIQVPGFAAPFLPGVEMAWRLARGAWGCGYATEAARAAAHFAFATLGLPELLAFTFEGNMPSRAVMQRLGMSRDPAEDFDHPSLPNHRLTRHVLYRLKRPQPA